MGTKARGRGVAATFGLLLVLLGIIGAVVLWVMAERRPEQAIDGFARGPVGCTTTLEFTDTGTFFVYEERVTDDLAAVSECEPVPTAGAEFSVELLDRGQPVALRDDTSIGYDTESAIGRSLARIEIDVAGRYDLVVVGPEPGTVAAVGRDPDAGVDELRRGALVVGVLGVLLGVLLLVLAGRRSKRAATYGAPDGPGWGPEQRPLGAWSPEPPRAPQRPVNPLLPPEPVQPSPTVPTAEPLMPPPPAEMVPAVPAPVTAPVPTPGAPVAGPGSAADDAGRDDGGEPGAPAAAPGPAAADDDRTDAATAGPDEAPTWPPAPPSLGERLTGAVSSTSADAEPPAGRWAAPRAEERKDPLPPG